MENIVDNMITLIYYVIITRAMSPENRGGKMIIINRVKRSKIIASGSIDEFEYDFDPPEVGKTYVVFSKTNVSPDAMRQGGDDPELKFTRKKAALEAGIAGNLDCNSRKFNGWRGTTNDISIDAYGLRKCISVKKRESNNGCIRYWIQFGPDESGE